MSYVLSNNISIYPSALRGGIFNTNTNQPFNPEARLNSEFNITNPVNRLTISGSFVTNYANNVLEFSIHGYYFKLNNINSVFNDFPDGSIWASIKLADLSPNSSYNLLSLSSWEASTNLDKQNNNNFEFTGIKFESVEATGANIYSLHILDKTTQGNSVTFTIPKSSLLKFDASNIKIDDEISLHDVIYKQNQQLTVDVDEFVGHLTGNVSGNLTGLASNSTDSEYATKIGTVNNTQTIGSSIRPVYVNASGQIVSSNGNVGSAYSANGTKGQSQNVYLDGGEIKAGSTIYISRNAPTNDDIAQPGDIWFQHI